MSLELDKKILTYALKDKKHMMELSNSVNAKYFGKETQWLFSLINKYFTDPKFKEIPSRDIVKEMLSADYADEKIINNCLKLFDEIKNDDVNDAEFSWHLNKLRIKYNCIVQNECSAAVDKIRKSDVDDADKIEKSNKILKDAVVNIDSIYKKQIYREGSLANSAEERFAKYQAVEANPEIARGTLTGFKEFDRKTNGLHPGEMMIVAGDTGCQPAGSKVLMADGNWKNIEDIVVGDIILSPQHDHTVVPNKIIKTFKFENRDIYEIKTSGKKQKKISYLASSNHILPIIKPCYKNHKYVGNKLFEMSIDDYNKKSNAWKKKAKIFTTPAFDLPKKDFIIPPYIVGSMLGDGCLTNNVNITSADEQIINAFREYKISLGKGCRKENNKASSYNIISKYKQIMKEIIGTYNSHNKRVPKEYLLGSLDQRLELLAGLIDTDGTLEEFSTTSKKLADDFIYLIYSVGGAASKKKRYTSYDGGKTVFPSYRVHYSFAEYSAPVRLKYKQQNPRNMNWKNPRNRAFKVKFKKKDTVYGFSLDGNSQWYITDNFITTHNTGKSVLMHNIGVNAYLGTNNPFAPLDAIKDDGKNVLYFSLEMPKESMERRIDSCMGGLYYNQLRDGMLSEEDKRKYFQLVKFQMVYKKQFYIVDMPKGASVRELELKYMEICETKFKPDLVVVDYLGIMSTSNKADGQDWLDLGHISAELHEFARVYNITVITGSQVNRHKEGGKMEHSTSRLARSSMVPNNANVIVQIACRDDEDTRTDMPVYITKMRDGEKGAFTLSKDFSKMKVIDMLDETYINEEDDDVI